MLRTRVLGFMPPSAGLVDVAAGEVQVALPRERRLAACSPLQGINRLSVALPRTVIDAVATR